MQNFTTEIKGYVVYGSYGALWEVYLALELLVLEDKQFTTHYTTLIYVKNQYNKIDAKKPNKNITISYSILIILWVS